MNGILLVKDWYKALQRGNLDAVLGAFAANVEWREAEGHPYQPGRDPWCGPDSVRDKLIVRLTQDWDAFSASPEVFHDAGAYVIVEGRYTGTFKLTGRSLNAQFCHIWRVADGKIVQFRQYMDTAQLREVTAQPTGGGSGSEGIPFSDPRLELLMQL